MIALKEEIERIAPHKNRATGNALASLLVRLGNPTEALELLSSNKLPESKHDWLDFHVAAMACYRTGKISEAIRRLEFGANKAPFYRVRSRFRCAFAAQRLREKQANEALKLLSLPRNIVPFPEWIIIRAHAEAESNELEKARADLNSITFRRHLQPAIGMLGKVYGLGRPAVSVLQRKILADELWEEEFRLLTSIAA